MEFHSRMSDMVATRKGHYLLAESAELQGLFTQIDELLLMADTCNSSGSMTLRATAKLLYRYRESLLSFSLLASHGLVEDAVSILRRTMESLVLLHHVLGNDAGHDFYGEEYDQPRWARYLAASPLLRVKEFGRRYKSFSNFLHVTNKDVATTLADTARSKEEEIEESIREFDWAANVQFLAGLLNESYGLLKNVVKMYIAGEVEMPWREELKLARIAYVRFYSDPGLIKHFARTANKQEFLTRKVLSGVVISPAADLNELIPMMEQLHFEFDVDTNPLARERRKALQSQ